MDHLRSIVDHDGAVILDIKNDQFFSLNSIGSLIWSKLREGSSIAQIKRELVVETGELDERVSADVDEFIEALKAKHLYKPLVHD